ncbi:hypothetical protein LN042_16315 [Kitasatospora sp. RB6PN24]|uniref:hypothetical protein n=1 Tax=Kitasatospora humi TaxID=2893891 RepID=UPI001E4D916B|nr:hypothetical protein [Kitasatospora humi]MCC9308629.1 hypothetical protein [Kitasatospora humi]
MSRRRLGLLAAGGVAGIVLAQVWGLGLDLARAAGSAPAAGSTALPPAADGRVTGNLLGAALEAGGTDGLAPDRIDDGGLPLPDRASDVSGAPDVPDVSGAPDVPDVSGAPGVVGVPVIAPALLPSASAPPGSPRDPAGGAAQEPAAPAPGPATQLSPRPAAQPDTAGPPNGARPGPTAGSDPGAPGRDTTERTGPGSSAAGAPTADDGRTMPVGSAGDVEPGTLSHTSNAEPSAPSHALNAGPSTPPQTSNTEPSTPSRGSDRGTRRAVNWLPEQRITRGPAPAQSTSDQPTNDQPINDQPADDQPAASQDSEPRLAARVGRAVLIPIAAGLLLTGAAMYKHRGLPRGHGH